MVYVDVPGSGTLTVRAGGDASYSEGETVTLAPQEARIHRFDADGKAIR
eukprot:gene20158-20708_t